MNVSGSTGAYVGDAVWPTSAAKGGTAGKTQSVPTSALVPLDLTEFGGFKLGRPETQQEADARASTFLKMNGVRPSGSGSVSDDAPANTYAQVMVNGKVAATLYNGGSSVVSNSTHAQVGFLEDPPGLAGPALAQWRAESYAKALGGKIVMAETALRPEEWSQPAPAIGSYERDQLDQAMDDMTRLAAQRHNAYLATMQTETSSGSV